VVRDIVERHRRDERRVAQRLKLHVPTVGGALQLYDDQRTVLVQGERSIRRLALSKSPYLGDKEPFLEDGDVSEYLLQCSFFSRLSEGPHVVHTAVGHLVERHTVSPWM
jgi:hypothetical protein